MSIIMNAVAAVRHLEFGEHFATSATRSALYHEKNNECMDDFGS